MAYTTINKPSDYFNTVLYTGNGGTQSITGVGFQPDFVWGKNRNTTNWHDLEDVVRGATKRLSSNATDAEATETNNFTSFDSDGFSVGSGPNVNGSGNGIVVWNWLAGGTPSSNTDGTITSSVSANTTSGFSIVSYTGTGSNATIGHGLGAVPKMIIVKDRDTSASWQVYHVSLGATKYLKLDTTDAEATNTNRWNDTEPTSSVFTVGTASGTNASGRAYIAYCFAEKKGFSKFGSYVGNGSNDGTFIYTGFKPALFIVKNTTASGYNWEIRDNKRDSYNAVGYRLEPNTSNAEASYVAEYDFVSNGIKIRKNGNNYNTSGSTYIYMAFAENPLVTTGKVPATAR